MKGYNIIDCRKLKENVTFIRIRPTDIGLTISDIFSTLTNLSWISEFDSNYIKHSFKARAEPTVEHLKSKVFKGDNDSITKDTGEIVVSELARQTIINELSYLDIPIGELIKQQKSGNPGFDFFSENLTQTILFGEAKYVGGSNAYPNAFRQIVKFIKEKRDETDLLDIRDFCSESALNNVGAGIKGFIGAFSSTDISSDRLVENIKKNVKFKEACNYEEIICVAVDIWKK